VTATTDTDTDAALLLRAVCADPACDTARLVFADRLDELPQQKPCPHCGGGRPGAWCYVSDSRGRCRTCRGTLTVIDASDRNAAEFIRVQVAMAALERDRLDLFNDETDWSQCTGLSASWCPNCGDCSCRDREESMSDEGCPLHAPASRHCCHENLMRKILRLHDRDRELSKGPISHLLLPPGVGGTVRRGFVAEISLTLSAFMEHAGAIFSSHPIERVTLTGLEVADVVPVHDALHADWPGWYFWCEDDGTSFPWRTIMPHDIPSAIFRELGGVVPPTHDHLRLFPTADEANAALSASCVAHGRSAAGLPPIPGGVA
jgi:uncharacterized protein (TIGR02996 family)